MALTQRSSNWYDRREEGRRHLDKLGYLSRINIMDVLPIETLMEVDRHAPMNTVRKGTLIMEPGQRTDVLFLLKERLRGGRPLAEKGDEVDG